MKPLHLVVIALFTCFSSTLAYAADTAIQQLTLQVPKVLLLDVENTSPSFELLAPTEAGQGFTGSLDSSKTSGNRPKVAITSNGGNATKLCGKAVMKDTNAPLNSANLQLTILDHAGFGDISTVFNTKTSGEVLTTIGNIVTGDINNTTHQLRLIPGISGSNPMPPYGSHAIEVTYTVTDASCP
ncbi:hypothetical protein [Candidatus Thiothrix anitrata]|uniref:Secreted protein n=1 Tax=Candidatus Thiothrix anitrata TaxID=2823902 RepID=A0ABX7X096_9GAMM|nr:hypothetical protein [Candidatus Thiothrix anitrata]QTR49006.1 hypothetical protein J8380_12060 [Candidatus Thiothrix anitrata]